MVTCRMWRGLCCAGVFATDAADWEMKWNADSCSAGLCLHLLCCFFSLIIWFETISKCLCVVGESLRVSSRTGSFLPVPESLFVMNISVFWWQVLFFVLVLCTHFTLLAERCWTNKTFVFKSCLSLDFKSYILFLREPVRRKTHLSRWGFESVQTCCEGQTS